MFEHDMLEKKMVMFRSIKKTFTELLTGLVDGSNHTKCVSWSNQKCKIQPTLINLHPDALMYTATNFTTIQFRLN